MTRNRTQNAKCHSIKFNQLKWKSGNLLRKFKFENAKSKTEISSFGPGQKLSTSGLLKILCIINLTRYTKLPKFEPRPDMEIRMSRATLEEDERRQGKKNFLPPSLIPRGEEGRRNRWSYG